MFSVPSPGVIRSPDYDTHVSLVGSHHKHKIAGVFVESVSPFAVTNLVEGTVIRLRQISTVSVARRC